MFAVRNTGLLPSYYTYDKQWQTVFSTTGKAYGGYTVDARNENMYFLRDAETVLAPLLEAAMRLELGQVDPNILNAFHTPNDISDRYISLADLVDYAIGSPENFEMMVDREGKGGVDKIQSMSRELEKLTDRIPLELARVFNISTVGTISQGYRRGITHIELNGPGIEKRDNPIFERLVRTIETSKARFTLDGVRFPKLRAPTAKDRTNIELRAFVALRQLLNVYEFMTVVQPLGVYLPFEPVLDPATGAYPPSFPPAP